MPRSDDLAQVLVSTGAVRVSVAEPFRWTSGLLAPFYVDCRVVLGFPEQRKAMVDGLAELTERAIGLDAFDVVVGGATAGIPMASLLAERFDVPLAYVRKEAKGHGRGRQVEGADVAGRRVLLFDELISRGSSVSAFARAEGGGRDRRAPRRSALLRHRRPEAGRRGERRDPARPTHAGGGARHHADVRRRPRRGGALPRDGDRLSGPRRPRRPWSARTPRRLRT